jgi:hypothetical protein
MIVATTTTSSSSHVTYIGGRIPYVCVAFVALSICETAAPFFITKTLSADSTFFFKSGQIAKLSPYELELFIDNARRLATARSRFQRQIFQPTKVRLLFARGDAEKRKD